MSSGFSFPPPPPPPPRQSSSGPPQQSVRGGRGVPHFGIRGRAGFRARGEYANAIHHYAPELPRALDHPPPYGPQGAPNANSWASGQAENMMAMYGLPVPPRYAQSLPGLLPGSYSPPTGPAMDRISNSRSTQPNAHHEQHSGKRKRESAPSVPAAPAVPSFGGPLPQWQPSSAANAAPQHAQGQQNQMSENQRKKQRKDNRLGLTPKSEDHENSEGDDADEEATLAAKFRNGPMRVEHGDETIMLASPDDIKAWVKDRKKKFPTKKRAQEKKEEEEQMHKERDLLQKQIMEQRTAKKEAQEKSKEEEKMQKEEVAMQKQIKEHRRKENEANKRKKDEKSREEEKRREEKAALKAQRRKEHEANIRKKQEKKKQLEAIQAQNQKRQEPKQENNKHGKKGKQKQKSAAQQCATMQQTSPASKGLSKEPVEIRTVAVYNISPQVSKTDLTAFFKDYSPESVTIVQEDASSRVERHAHVTLATNQQAVNAMRYCINKLLVDRKVSIVLVPWNPAMLMRADGHNSNSGTITSANSAENFDVPVCCKHGNPVHLTSQIDTGTLAPRPANDKLVQSMKPYAGQPGESEQFQAKAEKYRKLAEEADIAALEAKASDLGYNLVKQEVGQGPSSSAVPMSETGGKRTEHGQQMLSDASALTGAASTDVEMAVHHEAGSTVLPNSAVEHARTQPALPSANVSRDVRLPGLHYPIEASEHEVNSLVGGAAVPTATQSAQSAVAQPTIAGDEDENLFTIDTAGDVGLKVNDVDGTFAKSLYKTWSPRVSTEAEVDQSSSSASESSESYDSSCDSGDNVGNSVRGKLDKSNPEPGGAHETRTPKPTAAGTRCKFLLKTGHCRFRATCRYSHDIAPQDMPKRKEEQRKTLRERLIEQQEDERRKLVVGALKFLGDRGLLSIDQGEGR
ncbi:MAG: hypothetical protein Q9162_003113 [Coniocarpon cinnabarinum]